MKTDNRCLVRIRMALASDVPAYYTVIKNLDSSQLYSGDVVDRAVEAANRKFPLEINKYIRVDGFLERTKYSSIEGEFKNKGKSHKLLLHA